MFVCLFRRSDHPRPNTLQKRALITHLLLQMLHLILQVKLGYIVRICLFWAVWSFWKFAWYISLKFLLRLCRKSLERIKLLTLKGLWPFLIEVMNSSHYWHWQLGTWISPLGSRFSGWFWGDLPLITSAECVAAVSCKFLVFLLIITKNNKNYPNYEKLF